MNINFIETGDIVAHLLPGERACWIDGYAGLYAITDRGRVWSERRKRWRRIGSSGYRGNRYRSINLMVGGVRRDISIHRLVAEHFVPGRAEGLEVLHGPAGSSVNTIANLRWGTRSENMLQRRIDGTLRKGSRLNEDIATQILLRYHRPRGTRPAQASLASEFGVSITTINQLVTGKTHARVAKTVLDPVP